MTETTLARPLLAEAQDRCAQLLSAYEAVGASFTALYQATWDFGRTLCDLKAMKDVIPHGQWEFFVAHNFPDLGPTEDARKRRAVHAMAFFKMNPNHAMPRDFTAESIRACIHHLAPDKERPELEGDKRISPQPHPLTFINIFLEWDRKADIGLAVRPPVEVLQRDLEPVIRRIGELVGADYVRGLLS
jgi:hypothetical protein